MNNKTGLACPVCGAATTVKDSRRVNAGTIRRRRLCLGKCGERFTTYESTDNPLLPINHRSMLAATLAHLQEAATKVQVALRAMENDA